MKHEIFHAISVFLLLLFLNANALAQIGFNTLNPAPCSILDLSQMKKGFLLPRHDSINFGGSVITSSSLLLFDKNTSAVCFFDSAGTQSWQMLNPWYSKSGSLQTILLRTSGNVGIKTSTPQYKLTVNDSVRFANLTATRAIISSGIVTVNSNISGNGSITVSGNATADLFVGEGTVPDSITILWYGRLSELPNGWSVWDDPDIYMYIPSTTYQYNTGGIPVDKSESGETNNDNIQQGINTGVRNEAKPTEARQLYILIKN